MYVLIPCLCAALIAVVSSTLDPSLNCNYAATTTSFTDGPMDPCVDGDLVAAQTISQLNEGACDE